jgi:hypothetical protein
VSDTPLSRGFRRSLRPLTVHQKNLNRLSPVSLRWLRAVLRIGCRCCSTIGFGRWENTSGGTYIIREDSLGSGHPGFSDGACDGARVSLTSVCHGRRSVRWSLPWVVGSLAAVGLLPIGAKKFTSKSATASRHHTCIICPDVLIGNIDSREERGVGDRC